MTTLNILIMLNRLIALSFLISLSRLNGCATGSKSRFAWKETKGTKVLKMIKVIIEKGLWEELTQVILSVEQFCGQSTATHWRSLATISGPL